jgi:dTDP-L-rhamnose 4-epimerase
MNILITGGAGFIGSNLTLHLIALGHNVTVLDNLSPQIHGNDPHQDSPLFLSIKHNVTFIKGCVSSRVTLQSAIQGQEAIVHLAAETGTGQSMYEIEKYTNVNIQSTALLLDILANTKHTIKKVVVASSRSIYGEGKYYSDNFGYVYPLTRLDTDLQNNNFEATFNGDYNLKLCATDEDSKIHPSSVYGITKQVQEQLVMTVCPTIGIAPVAFRYQNVYGPGQSLSNPYTGILSIFSSLIRKQLPINVFEDGLESRDFVYIDDVVEATKLGIEKDEANGNVFNVGTGIPITVNTVVNELMKHFETEVPVNISGNYRLGDIRHNYADISKISSVLGFKPSINFETGCKHFVNWVKNQPINEVKYTQSLDELKEKGLLK